MLFFGGINTVYSCTCEQISHRKEYKLANVIFVGKVTDVSLDESYTQHTSEISSLREKLKENKRIIVKFSVLEQFKGNNIKELEMFDYVGGTFDACAGIEMEEDKTYLIYGFKDKEKFVIGGLCSRTQLFDSDSYDYKELKNWKY